jgi:L-serine/L-threonine ammonia-lyase
MSSSSGETFHINSPLEYSLNLSLHLQRLFNNSNIEVWCKMESAQPSGSFKIRGIGNLCVKAIREGKKTQIVSSSGGNAGLAAAYSAKQLGVPATIVVPSTTPVSVQDKLKAYGATVVVHGGQWAEADALARSMVAEKPDAIAYVHPFDGQDIEEGHSSIVAEIVVALKSPPDAIICSVGGGGLLCGIELGLRKSGLKVPIIAVETEGADSFSATKLAGKHIRLDAIRSIATTLGSAQVSERAFSLIHDPLVHSLVVSDRQAVQACVDFANDHRTLVEPACGAALAAVYFSTETLERVLSSVVAEKASAVGDAQKPLRVVVIVCGGSGISLPLLAKYMKLTGIPAVE